MTEPRLATLQIFLHCNLISKMLLFTETLSLIALLLTMLGFRIGLKDVVKLFTVFVA